MRLIDYIRTVLTLFLICGAYFETGVWTALCFVLIATGIEIILHYLKGAVKAINEILKERRA